MSLSYVTGCIYRDIINTVVCAKDGRPKHGLHYAKIVIIQKGCTYYPPWIRQMPLLEKVFVESVSVKCNTIFNKGYNGRSILVQAEHCDFTTVTHSKLTSTIEQRSSSRAALSSALKTSRVVTNHVISYSSLSTTPNHVKVRSSSEVSAKTTTIQYDTSTLHRNTTAAHRKDNYTRTVNTDAALTVSRNVILSTSIAILVTAVTTLAVLFLVVKCLQKRRTNRTTNRVCEGPYSIPLSIVNENFGNTSL